MKKSQRLLGTTLTLIAGAFLLPAAMAATATGSLQTQIVITSNCAVGASTTNMDFGSQASTSSAVNETTPGAFTVTCTNQTPYNIGLASVSTGSATGTGDMSTTGGITQKISYALYQDASRSVVWGSTVGTNTKASSGTGASQSFSVYGKTTSTLNVPAATYTDTVNITVTY